MSNRESRRKHNIFKIKANWKVKISKFYYSLFQKEPVRKQQDRMIEKSSQGTT